MSTLKQNENSEFIKTNLYNEMDATEKSMVSYNIGMMCSKLFMAKLFNTPWLMHVSNIANITTWKSTKSRPDLVGFNHRQEWVVVEAKGRTSHFDRKAIQTAKNQTRKIKSINGIYPSLKIATESYFHDQLKVALDDPDEYDDDAVELKIDITQYLNTYYSHMRYVAEDTAFLSEIYGIHIKLSEVLEEAIKKNDYKIILENIDKLHSPDGIIVKLDSNIWSEKNLLLNPKDRRF